MPDEANDPSKRFDNRQRAILTAVGDGFSEQIAVLSRKEFLPIILNGAVTMSANPLFGTVAAYREEKSRLFHGLKMHIGEKKSGRKRRKPKKVTAWMRRWQEV